MNYIGKRIYFNKQDGSVILDTGERCGAVVPTTVEEDVAFYHALTTFDQELLGHINLEYGAFKEEFATCSNYAIDTNTEEIIFRM